MHDFIGGGRWLNQVGLINWDQTTYLLQKNPMELALWNHVGSGIAPAFLPPMLGNFDSYDDIE